MGLVPGVSLAHWIGSRIAARGLTIAARFFTGGEGKGTIEFHGRPGERSGSTSEDDLESARGGSSEVTPAAAYGAYAKNALGLQGI